MAKRVRTGGGSSPSTKKTKDKTGEVFICVKCSKNVEEDSIECESCLKWEHRACAGISKEKYEVISGDLSTNIMFFCSVCRPKVRLALKFFNDIEEKQKLISENVKQLEEELKALNTKISQLSNQSNTVDTSSTVSQNDTLQVKSNARPLAPKPPPSDRKFNLVLYGISECPSGTSRPERVKQDLNSTVPVLSKLNADINPTSVRNCFRLGKYKKDHTHPRPILVKLNRSIDVTSILSNRNSIEDKSIIIKPDMSPDERTKETLLLKERWSLIQSGIDKSDIKIKSSSIYIKGKKHGYVSHSVFTPVSTHPSSPSSQIPQDRNST